MDELCSRVYMCRRCRLWMGAKHGVPGEGPLDAEVMLVGQNPGAEEDATGRPFVGRAGRYLTNVLAEYGIKREKLFITNVVKHTSPNNRKPYHDEVTACLPYLQTQIGIINPKLIVLLGALVKQIPRVVGVEYFEVIHPSAAMRFPESREKFKSQIAELAKKIEALNAK